MINISSTYACMHTNEGIGLGTELLIYDYISSDNYRQLPLIICFAAYSEVKKQRLIKREMVQDLWSKR